LVLEIWAQAWAFLPVLVKYVEFHSFNCYNKYAGSLPASILSMDVLGICP
jgi:hypothetical protein